MLAEQKEDHEQLGQYDGVITNVSFRHDAQPN